MKGLLRRTLLRFALAQPALVLTIALLLLVAAFSLYPQMNKDFLPKFQEETALVAATAAPGTSLEEMNKISDVIEQQILSVPEVRKVGRRLGRAERGDHVVPVSTAEFDVDFREPSSLVPAEQGTPPATPAAPANPPLSTSATPPQPTSISHPQPQPPPPPRTRKEVLADLTAKIKSVPGVFAVVGGPLADRIGHMMSGVSAPVAIKIFGPDLEQLRSIGIDIQKIARTIPGFEDCKLDQTATIPQLRIEADRDRSKAYGIAPGRLNNMLSALIGGQELAELREGQRKVNLVMRLPPEWRDSPDKVASLPIETEEGQRIPLDLVADVREAKGPNVIFREASQRRFALAIKPTVQDVTNLVERLRKEVSEKVKLPEGYFITFEGEFQAQEEATQRIALYSAVVFIAVFLMLYGYFRSASLALQVLVNIPLALMGGLAFTWFKLNNISIATLVGFIAVGGVAARNGIMMISHYLHLMRHEGEKFTRSMIERGTLERLVPVLMTALSAGIGLIPLVLAADQPGKEILHPVAVVIVGGLVSSTFLDMAITPAMFYLLGRKAAHHAIAEDAPASH